MDKNTELLLDESLQDLVYKHSDKWFQKFFPFFLNGQYELSTRSGIIYPIGHKPVFKETNNGIKTGNIQFRPNDFGGYDTYRYNGNEYIQLKAK